MKRAIVDVDGTLWDLHRPLHAMFKKLYPDMPDFYMITTDWNWYKDYMSDGQFYAVVDIVHDTQFRYPAFDGAKSLFNELNRQNYEIIVASHRRPDRGPEMADWLKANELVPYSGIYVGEDKTTFIKPHDLVIDDAPKTIKMAYAWGCEVHYLAWPWNEGLPGNRWANLDSITGAIADGTGRRLIDATV